jgi:hypothetical protein
MWAEYNIRSRQSRCFQGVSTAVGRRYRRRRRSGGGKLV